MNVVILFNWFNFIYDVYDSQSILFAGPETWRQICHLSKNMEICIQPLMDLHIQLDGNNYECVRIITALND